MMGGPGRMLQQDTLKPQKMSETLRRFGGYFRKHWQGLVLALILIFIGTWTQVLSPDLIGQSVDCYLFPQATSVDNCWYADLELDQNGQISLDNSERLEGLTGLVLLLVGIYFAGAFLNGLAFYAMNWSGQNVLRQMRQDLFKHIHRLSLGYFAKNDAGDVMSRVTNDTDSIQQAFSFGLLQVLSSLILIVWVIIRMMQENVLYALVSLSIVPFVLLATMFFSAQARRAFRKARRELGSVNADLQEGISGAREVQAFNREDESIAAFVESNDANRNANIRAAVWTSALRPVLEALGFVSLGIVVLAGGLSVLHNEPFLGTSVISLGLVFAFIAYVQRINQPIAQIAVMWANIQSAIAGGERIFGLLDEEVDIVNKPNAKDMPPIQGEITFENVSAEYVKGEPVLKGIDFHATQGQTVAIVGPTGAGKTTIINLIPRFYDVTDGVVKIDGIDVRDVELASLRTQIGIVLQDTFLFSTTVMENIRFGRLTATDDEVIEAAKMVGADGFIERLTDGYQTVLGERGGGLSQGQRQLIAIARAALMQPSVLILDEATSSVDTRTERVIQKAFETLLEGRTSFVIAHRLSTIRNADQVMMLKDGEIIERGTHHSLLEQQGAYYDLYMSQFSNQEDSAKASPQTDPIAGEDRKSVV